MDTEPYAKKRDKEIQEMAKAAGVEVVTEVCRPNFKSLIIGHRTQTLDFELGYLDIWTLGIAH